MPNQSDPFLNCHKDQSTYISALKSYILDNLPAAYPRNSSANVLKGFTIRMSLNETFYAAVATAELGMPSSMVDMGEEDMHEYEAMVLEDEFIEARSCESALEALEMLCDEVEAMIEEGAGDFGCEYGADDTVFQW